MSRPEQRSSFDATFKFVMIEGNMILIHQIQHFSDSLIGEKNDTR